jgi:phage-related protein
MGQRRFPLFRCTCHRPTTKSDLSTPSITLQKVHIFANIFMSFEICYFHERVFAEVQTWPVDVLADYARLLELLSEHGPNLRLPHSRAFGDGLFELRPRGRTGIGRAFYCFLIGKKVIVLHAFIKKSQQTPDDDLKIARKRLKEVKNG